MFRSSIDKVDQSGAAVEFSKKDGSIGLKIRVFDPLKTRSEGAVIITAFTKDSTAITAHPHGWLFGKEEKRARKLGEKGENEGKEEEK